MTIRILLGALLIVLLLIFSGVGHSQVPQQQPPQCGPADMMIRQITTGKWQEREAIGLVTADGKATIRLFINSDTQTWTLIAFGPTGTACVAGAGAGIVQPSIPPPGKPL